jgi:D-inositol-3-phosphate glycosyltransferase
MLLPKIGILCNSHSYGGLEINTLRLCQWLTQAGWSVSLLLSEKSSMYANAHDFTVIPNTISEYGHTKLRAKTLHQWVTEQSIEVLLVVYNKDLAIASWYKRCYNRKIKLIYQQHMKVGIKKKDWIHTFRYAMIDLWISPLHYLKQETLQLTRVPENKIAVVPLSIEVENFTHPPIHKTEARAVLNLPNNAFIIGVLGRLDPQKGQDFLVKILKSIRHIYPDVHLLIMGNATLHEGDAYVQKVKKLAEDPEIKDFIHFRAHQPDPYAFYQAINVFAIPSHGETYGMVTIEAMASGVPVIGTDRDGTREILQNGKYGWLHAYEDEQDFIEEFTKIKQGIKVNEKIKLARKHIEAHYTVPHMISGLGKAIQQLFS